MPSKPQLKGAQPARVPEGPTFRPSAAEFVDPLAYIASIRAQAEAFGACKIVPPAGWRPPFMLDTRAFRFKTRLQSVHELQERSAAEEKFEDEYLGWLRAAGRTWRGPPVVNGREVDLYRLWRLVGRRGGYEQVSAAKGWRDICKLLQVREKASNAAYVLRQLYQKHLLGFEEQSCRPAAEGAKRKSREPSPAEPAETAGLEKLVAAAGGGADAELLGAVAALMDAPADAGSSSPAPKRRKASASGGAAKEAVRVPSDIHTMVCELCRGGHAESRIILCDRCDRGCHTFCLQPPLDAVPGGAWVCPLCVAEEVASTAHRDGRELSWDQFERQARQFKADWFGGQAAADQASVEEIERAFWEVVEGGEEPVEVAYGADIDTSLFGSAFPTRAADGSLPADAEAAKYAADPWNLNNLPRLPGSLLRHLRDDVMGVTLPWMYVGMLFSSFCWHTEDHLFYSINYNHFGAAKRWYCVPGAAAGAFEAAFRGALPELFEKQPDVLSHLTTMLSPRALQQAGVPVHGLTQNAGEFVVTFPRAYHGGLNCGLNCAEAVNFAPPAWLAWAPAAAERARAHRRPPVVCHEWLLLRVAGGGAGGEAAARAARELARVAGEEAEWRCRLRQAGCVQSRQAEPGAGLAPGSADDPECCFCRALLHLSGVECRCCPGRMTCLRHAAKLCDCPPASWRLAFRHTLGQLEATAAELAAAAPPELLEQQAAGEPPQAQQPGSSGAAAAMDAGGPGEPQCQGEGPMAADAAESAEAAEATEAAPAPESKIVDLRPPGSAEGGAPTPVPRRRGRKARGGQEAAEKVAEESPRAPPVPRLTRAAIKAEEEAAEQMDVLTALTGLAGAEGAGGEQPAAAAAAAEPEATPLKAEPEAEGEPGPSQPTPAPEPPFDTAAAVAELRGAHREWRARAAEALSRGGARATDVEALVQQAQQFAWAYPDVQEGVAEALAGLRAAQDWAHKMHGFMRVKPGLEEAEAALGVSPHPIAIPGLSRLAEGARGARAWLAKAGGVVDARQTDLKALELLANEGARLPVALPQIKTLKERVAAARQLVEAVRAALKPKQPAPEAEQPPQPTPEPPPRPRRKSRGRKPDRGGEAAPEEAGDEAAAGKEQATPPPEAQGAKQAEAGVVTLDWLRAARSQAAALRVAFPELEALTAATAGVESFQTRLQAALTVKPTLPQLEALAEEAAGLAAPPPEMQRVQALVEEAEIWLARAKAASQPRQALKRMREVLHAGLRLGTELPEVEALRGEIRRREWEEHARKALTNKQSAHALAEVLEDASAVAAQDGELAAGLRRRLDAARGWEARAGGLLEPGARPAMAELRALVDEGAALGVRMERLAAATALLHAAVSWEHRAQAAVEAAAADPPTVRQRPTLAEAEGLLQEYGGLSVTLPQEAALAARRDAAQRWVVRAQAVLADPPQESRTAEYEALLAEGEATGLRTTQQSVLRGHLHALRWAGELAGYAAGQAAALPVARARQLLAEGDSLPVDAGLCAQLRADIAACQQWEEGLAEAGEDSSRLPQFVEAAGRMRLQPDSLATMNESLAAANDWHARAERLLDGGERPQLAELSAIAAAAGSLPVRREVVERVQGVLTAGEGWRELTRRLWAKRNSGQRLDRCLFLAIAGLETALQQLQPPAAGAPPVDPAQPAREVYCVCQQPYDAEATMIGCDSCEEWLHVRCVGLTQSAARQLKKYTCPLCLAVRGNTREMEVTLTRTRKTKRPAVSQLRQVLAEARELPCAVDEAEPLSRVLELYDVWAAAAAEKPRHGDPAALSQLVKSALSLEVSNDELQYKLLAKLHAVRWRERIADALAPDARVSVDTLDKLEREGAALRLPGDDPSRAALAARLAPLRAWLGPVGEVLACLAQRGGDPVAAAAAVARGRELAAAGAAGLGLGASLLPKGFDRELARLEEAVKLYCLCQQPYNEEQPMLGCDHCQEWYHYGCVGLQPPREDQADADVAPPDWRCPPCCRRVGLPIPNQERLPHSSLHALGLAPAPPPPPQPPPPEAARLHELLSMGHVQSAAMPPPQPPPANSWLLTVLAQQQRLRPAAPAPNGNNAVPQQEQAASSPAT